MSSPRRLATGFVALACSLLPLAATGAAEPPLVEFSRDVAPILQRCTRCHGAERQEAGLRLDSGGGIRAGGDSGPVVVAGKPEESLLLRAVEGADDIERMPPEGDPLTADQIAVL
ncbi:MAG: hypothetical protein J5I93_27135, partial [Pirellulaceae bacterium]|nr:hypothetical protein [Pirellulaceae bacterium]